MKTTNVTICILIVLVSIGLTLGDEITTINGIRFYSDGMVDGFGVSSSYKSSYIDPLFFHSHNSGCGVYSTEFQYLIKQNIDVNLKSDEYYRSNKTIQLREKTSAAYSETNLKYPGSFSSDPIKSKWSDSALTASVGGSAIKADINNANVMDKEMIAKDSSMDLSIKFNGTAKINAFIGNPLKNDLTLLIDDYYKGSFEINKNMKISGSSSTMQNEDEWLPCCLGYSKDFNTSNLFINRTIGSVIISQ